MQTHVPAPIERRQNSLTMVQKLLEARNETLILYTQLAGHKPFHENTDIEPLMERFCQSLIDYTARAHFQLYRYIAERIERRQSVLDIAQEVYPRISDTTETILAFNANFERVKRRHKYDKLEADLSRLGHDLAERIKLEDRLLGVLTEGKQAA